MNVCYLSSGSFILFMLITVLSLKLHDISNLLGAFLPQLVEPCTNTLDKNMLSTVFTGSFSSRETRESSRVTGSV